MGTRRELLSPLQPPSPTRKDPQTLSPSTPVTPTTHAGSQKRREWQSWRDRLDQSRRDAPARVASPDFETGNPDDPPPAYG